MNREETIRQARLQLVLREGSREVALTEQVHEYRNRPCIPPALLLLRLPKQRNAKPLEA